VAIYHPRDRNPNWILEAAKLFEAAIPFILLNETPAPQISPSIFILFLQDSVFSDNVAHFKKDK
jgi:hypothetical protein